MKIIGKILVLFALCTAGSASAQTLGDTACVPYKMPIDSTITSCGPGLIGSKYKTATKVCPGGTITLSTEYDTSGCAAAPSPAGTVNNTSRCRLMPDSCANAPVAQNCASGAHWTLLGSNIAHCVQDDPACPWGTSLKHDSLGNPSCEQNTCPSNQVLQGDGKSCACGANLAWNGSTCVPATPTCVAGDVDENWPLTCSSGSGFRWRHAVTTCPSGAYGAPNITHYWDDTDCTGATPTCTSSTTQENGSCNVGQTGNAVRSVSTSCPSGAFGSPSTSYSSWDYSGCSTTTTTPTTPATTEPSCIATSSTSATSCGVGYTGTKYVTVKQLCPSGASTSEDTSGCGCANGAADFPTCTPVAAPPPVTKTCKTISRVVQTDTSIACGGANSTSTTTQVERQTYAACTYSDGTYTETRTGGTDYGLKKCSTGVVTWY